MPATTERALRVAIDARCFQVEHLPGPARALDDFIARTSVSGAVEWQFLIDGPSRGVSTWEQYRLPREAQKLGCDLLHAPGPVAPWWQPIPTVVTIADMSPWMSGSDPSWPPGYYRDRLMPAAYRKASAIVTLSAATRRDILARWPGLKPTLHLISPGVHERFLDAEPDREPLTIDGVTVQAPYLLYVGGADPRQRLTWALQAWWSSATASQVSMIVCGVDAHAHAAIRRSVPREMQQRLVLASSVPPEHMPRLYMRATAVLCPSLYDTFGFTVVEAQAVGTPVLHSDVGSLSELKSPGAIVLPVDDMTAWTRATDLVVQSRVHRNGPDRIARAWARQYSADAFANRLLAVYASVVHQRRTEVNQLSQRATP